MCLLVSDKGKMDNSSMPLEVCRDIDVKSQGTNNNQTGESLRAKYCDECKTKQGEEDVA